MKMRKITALVLAAMTAISAMGLTAMASDTDWKNFKIDPAEIPQEKLDRIFEQFYRLDAARSTSGGAGLGLAIAQQITQLHGGKITAESERDRIKFEVTLPVM